MRRTPVAVAALLTALAAGCASTSTVADPSQQNPTVTSTRAADPARLVGAWHLTAPDEPRTAILTIGDRLEGSILLFRPCGMLSGSWRANRHGMFVATIDGGDGACYGVDTANHQDPAPRWLPDVVGFRADGTDELLLDRSGRTIARLRP